MSVDELTDEAFFDLYKNNPQIRGLVDEIQVDEIQKQHHAHKSQEGQPGYDPGNKEWYVEAKDTVSKLIKKQKPQTHEKSPGLFGVITQPKAALGLIAIVLMLGMMASPVGATAGYQATAAYAAMPVY